MCLLTIEIETSDLSLFTGKIHFRPKYDSYLFDKTLSNAKHLRRTAPFVRMLKSHVEV